MDNKFTQIGIQYSSFGDNAQIEVQQTIIVPRKSTPIPSDVRQRSPNFVGRVDDLRDLHEALQKEKIVSVCAVRGMGGVGKTELAIQYALSKEFQQRYVACYWFSLNEGSLASLVLQKAAPYLAMPEEIQKSDDVYDQVKWCWQNWHPLEGEVLVILDDVKSLDDIPKQAMPINPRFKVMLTTRQRNLSPSFRELQLGVLPKDEALKLLQKIVDRDGSSRIESELETAKEICRYLGYLPLAIKLAATYINDDEMLTLGKYWEKLSLQDESLSDKIAEKIGATRGVMNAFLLSWQRLDGMSQQLAMLLGRFAPADIPWQDLVEPTVKSLGWDESSVRKGRIQLANLHLISIREQKNIGIHSLLREYFRWQSDQKGDDFIRVLQRAIVETGISSSKTIPPAPVKTDIEHIRIVIPHLELISVDMLDDIPCPEQDLIWAFLGICRFYKAQGLYASAISLLQNSLSNIESRIGSEHHDIAIYFNNLANLYKLKGNYGDAEPFYLHSLKILEKQLGTEHSYIAINLNDMGNFYCLQGKYSEAEKSYLKAFTIYEHQPETNYIEISTCLSNLANLYWLQKRYSESESLYIRSIDIDKQIYEEDHPNIAINSNNLANLYRSQERYSEAETLYSRSLKISEHQLGLDHPDIAVNLNNLAAIYQAQERYSEAEPLYLRSLEIIKQKLGIDHPNYATSLNNVAGLYRTQGRLCEAESFYDQALDIRERHLKTDHPDVIVSLNNLAILFYVKGDYCKAEPLLLRLLSIVERQQGVNHPETAFILDGLANVYRLQENYKKAETIYKRLLKIQTETSHFNIIDTLNGLALIYRLQEQYKKAELTYVRLIEIQERNLGKAHPDVAISLNNLAFLYDLQSKYSDAKFLYKKALAILEISLGMHHPHTQAIRDNLQDL